jgi:dTDP-glucose 4,6-dehydratase
MVPGFRSQVAHQSDTTVLVTGGYGFIGSNLIRHIIANRPGWRVVNMDSLTYAGNPANLADIDEHPNYVFVEGDISELADAENVFDSYSPWGVINCAAESHVDRSLEDGKGFVRTNVLGTQTLLELARVRECRFLQVSTDEVYGSLGPQGKFTEEMPLSPNSPYAATKASADLLVLAAFRSYGQDVVITRSSNNYGPYQYPEKLIPLMITNSLESQPLPIYGEGTNVRDWIHVTDHCEGLVAALEKGTGGRIYNLGGDSEQANLRVVQMILGLLQQPESSIRFVPDRPGHDERYALDFQRATAELDWQPKIGFEQGLGDTVAWYVENREWWESIRSGAYRQYYAKQYDSRLKDLK